MKITIEDGYGKSVVETVRKGLDIHEMMDLIERVLMATSYHPEVIKCGFIEKAEEYEENK